MRKSEKELEAKRKKGGWFSSSKSTSGGGGEGQAEGAENAKAKGTLDDSVL